MFFTFDNGKHVGESAIVTSYTPNSNAVIWTQPTISANSNLVSISQEQGFSFAFNNYKPTAANTQINQITLFLQSFDSLATRFLIVNIHSGTISGPVILSQTFSIPNQQLGDLLLAFSTNSPVISVNQLLTVGFQDVTSGGNSTGYINIYGSILGSTDVVSNLTIYPRFQLTGIASTSPRDIVVFNNTTSTIIPINPQQGIFGGNKNNGMAISGNGLVISSVSGTITGNQVVSMYTNNNNNVTFTQSFTGSDETSTMNIINNTDLSTDGSIVAFGVPTDNSSIGAAWVFKLVNGVYIQQGTKLVGTGASGGINPQQGTSVAISGDGNTLASGGIHDNSGIGATWIFTQNSGSWIQQGTKLVGTGGIGSLMFQGTAVSLSGDGNTLAIGGIDDNSAAGAVWIFTRSGTVWTQQGAKLVGTGAIGTAHQGTYLNLSSDGATLVESGTNDNGGTGAFWVFKQSGGVWTQFGSKIVSPDINAASFGAGIQSSTNGLRIITSSQDTTGSEIIYYYALIGSSYVLASVFYSNGSFAQTTMSNDGLVFAVNNLFYNYPFYVQTDPSIEYGNQLTPIMTGVLSNITFNLSSFESVSSGRTLTFKVYSGSGLGGTLLYTGSVVLNNTLQQSNYTLNLPTPQVSLFTPNTYTLSLQDTTAGGAATGNVTLQGIKTNSSFVSYNSDFYPYMNIQTPSAIITFSPPKDFSQFLNNGSDLIEFNVSAIENFYPLHVAFKDPSRTTYYALNLKYLSIPNKTFQIPTGGTLKNFPYIYVQLFNDGKVGSLNTISSDNPSSTYAVFKVPINCANPNTPTFFYNLTGKCNPVIVRFRPDQNIRFRLTTPNGIILVQAPDFTPPLFPNPLSQVAALFTVYPVDAYGLTSILKR